MIKDIDKSDVIGPHLVQSPIRDRYPQRNCPVEETLMLMALMIAEKFLTLQRVVITAQSGY